MTAEQIVYHAIAALEAAGVPYMVVGSFSSNLYGVARSTRDADFVVELGTKSPTEIADRLGADFLLDPQMSFETITGTYRFIASHRTSAFKVEFFLLSDDPHDRERFPRRTLEPLGDGQAYVATPEDVIVTKLRWSKGGNRKKDVDDVRNVIRVSGATIDWTYVERWCDAHGTRVLLDRTRTEAGSNGPASA
jgi:hypothetical protein